MLNLDNPNPKTLSDKLLGVGLDMDPKFLSGFGYPSRSHEFIMDLQCDLVGFVPNLTFANPPNGTHSAHCFMACDMSILYPYPRLRSLDSVIVFIHVEAMLIL